MKTTRIAAKLSPGLEAAVREHGIEPNQVRSWSYAGDNRYQITYFVHTYAPDLPVERYSETAELEIKVGP